jgi:hypothetical protein
MYFQSAPPKGLVVFLDLRGAIHQFMPKVMPEIMPAGLIMEIMPAFTFDLQCILA